MSEGRSKKRKRHSSQQIVEKLREADALLITGQAPLRQLAWQPGEPMGFFVSLTDMDGSPTIDDRKSWAKQQVMHWPYKPNFALWNDVRNTGELMLE